MIIDRLVLSYPLQRDKYGRNSLGEHPASFTARRGNVGSHVVDEIAYMEGGVPS